VLFKKWPILIVPAVLIGLIGLSSNQKDSPQISINNYKKALLVGAAHCLLPGLEESVGSDIDYTGGDTPPKGTPTYVQAVTVGEHTPCAASEKMNANGTLPETKSVIASNVILGKGMRHFLQLAGQGSYEKRMVIDWEYKVSDVP
jgi:hypothetical protein